MSSTHVLEAVVVATVMLGAVAYVSTYENPVLMPDKVGDIMSQRAWDFLRVYNDMPWPDGPCVGNTALEQMIVEAVGNESTLWRERRDKIFGSGFDTNLYMSNMRALYPLQEKYDFMGTTEDLIIQPDFTYVKTIGPSLAAGAEKLPVETAALRAGQLLRAKGEAVEFRVNYSMPGVDSTVTTWSKTAMVGNDTESRARNWTQNVSWRSGAEWNLTRKVEVTDLALFQGQTAELGFDLLLNASPNSTGLPAVIPAGTRVTIQLPSDWNATDFPNPYWNTAQSEGEFSQTRIVAQATAPIASSSVVTFRARPPANPTHPFDVFHASLSNGSYGESSLVVTYPAPIERDLPREIYPTLPYPLRPNSTAIIGLVFANGGNEVNVTSLDITIPGGYDLTANNATGAKLFGGTPIRNFSGIKTGNWRLVNGDGRFLQWRGNVTVPALSTTSWLVEVPITGDASQATSVEPTRGDLPTSNLTFANGFADASAHWGKSPGILRHRVPNATIAGAQGYPGNPSAVGTTFRYNATTTAFRATATIESNYTISPAADALRIHNGIRNSSFEIASRIAPLGSTIRADADLQGIVNALALQGVSDVTVNISMYAPPSLGCKPTASWILSGSSMPLAGILNSFLWDPLGSGVGSLFMSAADGRVYRIESGGAPSFETALTTAPIKILQAKLYGTPAILALQAGGNVTALHAVTGATIWRTTLPRADSTATSIAFDEATARIAVGWTNGTITLLDPAGAYVGMHAAAGGSVRELQYAPGGHLIARKALRIQNMTNDASYAVNAEGLAVSNGRGLVAIDWVIHVVDLETMTIQNEVLLDPSQLNAELLVAAGDIVGDTAPDMAVALEDNRLAILDGSTLALQWFTPPYLLDPPPPKHPLRILSDAAWPVCNAEFTGLLTGTGRYTDEYQCLLSDLYPADGPRLLKIEAGHLLYAYDLDNIPRISLLAHGNQHRWTRPREIGPTVNSLAFGRFGVTDAAFIGYTDGVLEQRSATTGAVVTKLRPTEFVGKFAVNVKIPMGGFYGTHLLLATLEWVDGAGVPQSASLADWFEVVDVDGSPVTNPTYRIILVVGDKSDPLTKP